MKRIIPLAVAILCLSACQSLITPKNSFFDPSVLKSHFFDINPNEDNTLTLDSGLEFFIPSGALEGANPVKVEVKEALDVTSMLAAGITTQAGAEPLSSAGMFYLNAENAKLVKPIGTKLPAKDGPLDSKMKRYTGEIDENGNLNWTAPKDLPADNFDGEKARLAQGKTLYNELCADCHTLDVPKIETESDMHGSIPGYNNNPPRAIFIQDGGDWSGVPLHHLYKYREQDWLIRYVRDATSMIWSRESDTMPDKDARCTWEYWGVRSEAGMMGRSFTNEELSNDDIVAVLDYIETYSEANNIPVPPFNKELCKQECELLNKQMQKIQQQRNKLNEVLAKQQTKRDATQKKLQEAVDNIKEEMVTVERGPRSFPPVSVGDITVPARLPTIDKVTKTKRKSGYYTFEVEALGWSNIDALVGDENNKESQLFVEVEGEHKDRIEVHFVLESQKIHAAGGIVTAGAKDIYAFYETSGSIPLPQGEVAWVYAMGEEKGKFFFAQKAFTTTLDNKISLSPKVVTQKEIQEAMKLMSSELDVNIQDSGRKAAEKVAAKLEKMDLKMDKLQGKMNDIQAAADELRSTKPSACICDCEFEREQDNTL